MAIRFDAVADNLSRTSDLLNFNSVYTFMAWVYLISDLNDYQLALTITNDTEGSGDYLGTSSDGITLNIHVNNGASGVDASGSALSLNTWTHLTMVRASNTNIQAYLNGVSNLTNTNNVASRGAVDHMTIGRHSSQASNRWNGRITAVKAWSTNLTAAEIAAEQWSFLPKRWANLYGFWPLINTAHVGDFTTNARNWTTGGTLTTEDSVPNVAWGTKRRRIFQVPAVAGNLSINISDAVTVGELTPVNLVNQPKGLDAVTVGELTPVDMINQPKVSDAVTVGELITVSLPVLPATVSDAVTVGELTPVDVINQPKVSDAVTVGELTPVDLVHQPKVSDAVTIDESVTLGLALPPNVSDAITIGELTPVNMVNQPKVSDAVTVGELVTLEFPLPITVSDAVTVGELTPVDVVNQPKVSDAVTVGELTTVSLPILPASVSDAVTVGELTPVDVVHQPKVSDAVSVGELTPVDLVNQPKGLDAVTLGELVTSDIIIQPKVSNAVTLGEVTTLTLSEALALSISVSDAVTLGEVTTVLLPFLAITIEEGITIGEVSTITLSGGLRVASRLPILFVGRG